MDEAREDCEVLVLVGPKGAGKTTLGRMIERRLGVHFLHVEAIAQRVRTEHAGPIDEHYARLVFARILAAVAAAVQEHGRIVIESTGASDETRAFFAELCARHEVRLVRVRASRETCEARMAERDATQQVAVPPELVRRMHERSVALELAWDCDLDNEHALTDDEVVAAVRPLLRQKDAAPAQSGARRPLQR